MHAQLPNTTASEYLVVPSEGTLWRRLRNTLAVAGIASHSLSVPSAIGHFILIDVGGTAYGLIVGWLASVVRKRLSDWRLDVSSTAMALIAIRANDAEGCAEVLSEMSDLLVQAQERGSTDHH